MVLYLSGQLRKCTQDILFYHSPCIINRCFIQMCARCGANCMHTHCWKIAVILKGLVGTQFAYVCPKAIETNKN